MKPAIRPALMLLALFSLSTLTYGNDDDCRVRIREFVVMGYQGIQIDLMSGKGPYLRTLLDLLKIPTDAEKKTTDQLASLGKANLNIMDFADQVVLLGTEVQASAMAMADVPVPKGPGIYTGEKLMNALEHLARGMGITVTLKTGERLKGMFVDYSARRLWIRGAFRRVVSLDDILALEAPQL